jgi:hypothetical protein
MLWFLENIMGPNPELFKVFTAMGFTDQKDSLDALLNVGRTEAYTSHSKYQLDASGGVSISEAVSGSKPISESSKFSPFKADIHLGHFSIQYDTTLQDSQNQPKLLGQLEMDKPFVGSNQGFHIDVADGQGKPVQVVEGSFSSSTGSCDEVIKDPSGKILAKAHSTSDGIIHPNNFTIDTEYRDANDRLLGNSHQAVILDAKTHDMTVDTTATKAK